MAKIERNITVGVNVTPEELASCFCDMFAEDQALFFNHIAMSTEKWGSSFCFQLQSVIDSKTLTSDGKKIMRLVGEYGGV